MREMQNKSSAGSTFKGIRIGVLYTFLSVYSNKELITKFSEAVKPILKKTNMFKKNPKH